MIIGHQKIIKILKKSIEKENIAQAYLFAGPESVGKFAVAKLFAASLISNQNINCADTSTLPMIKVNERNNNLLDLIVIEPEKEEKRGIIKEKEIKIEKIRAVQKELCLYPYQGKYKVLIINSAHKMTGAAQNALLKILEEPNPTSIVILVASDNSKILPTIRSRCRIINFNLVGQDMIKKELAKRAPANLEEIVYFSLGRPGIALKIMEDKKEFDFYRDAFSDLKNFSGMGINQKIKLAEKLSKDITWAVKELKFWIWILRRQGIKNLSLSGGNSVQLFKIIGKIEKQVGYLENTNANCRLILENLLINL